MLTFRVAVYVIVKVRSFCHLFFATLSLHVHVERRQDGIKLTSCPNCQNVFLWLQSLDSHSRRHCLLYSLAH